MTVPLESLFNHLRGQLLSLHHRTALLESLGWDEEALEVLLDITLAEMSRLLKNATEDEKATPIILVALRESLKSAADPCQIDIVMELLQAEAASFFESSKEKNDYA